MKKWKKFGSQKKENKQVGGKRFERSLKYTLLLIQNGKN